MQGFSLYFSLLIPGNFDGFSADSDGVDDVLPDGLTDESDDVQTEGTFPRSWTFMNFFPAILLGTFTVN